MLYARGIASCSGNGNEVPAFIHGGTGDLRGFILLEEGVDQESPVYSRSRDADAVQAISTTCSRSSFIFNPATKRSIVSKLFYFCLPATLNPP